MPKTKQISVPMYGKGIMGDALVNFSEQCLSCKHLYENIFECHAFPKGIPAKIYTGKFNHKKKYPGDHGIQFAPIETTKVKKG